MRGTATRGIFEGGPGVELPALSEDATKHVCDFAERGVCLDTIEDGGDGVLRADGSRAETPERADGLGLVSSMAKALKSVDLGLYGRWVDALEFLDGRGFGLILVDSDDDAIVLLDLALEYEGAFVDFVRLVSVFESCDCASASVYFVDVVEGDLLESVGEGFDIVRSCEGIDRVRDAGFVCEYLLGAKGYLRGFFGWEPERFIARVDMERLGASEYGGERLDGGADDVVFGLLRGESDPCGLGVESQAAGTRVPGVEAVAHDRRPHAARGTKLGDLFEEVVLGGEEEGEA